MIPGSLIDVLIEGGLALVRGIVGLFPSYSLPASVSGWGETMGSALASANSVFPVVTLGICLAVAFSVRLWLALVDLALYVYALFPFKAT